MTSERRAEELYEHIRPYMMVGLLGPTPEERRELLRTLEDALSTAYNDGWRDGGENAASGPGRVK